MGKYVAVAGKGGVGKTTFTALMLRQIVQWKKRISILAVDADPNANLNEALGLNVVTTISELLEQTKNPKAIPEGMPKNLFIFDLPDSAQSVQAVDKIIRRARLL